MCPWGKTLLGRETEQMVKLSTQLRILACISQKQEKELMLENSLNKEGIVLQTQRLSTGCTVSTSCTQRCRIDSSSLKSFTNHRTAMQSKVQAFHAPCKMLQPSSLEKGRGWRVCRGERAAKKYHRSCSPDSSQGRMDMLPTRVCTTSPWGGRTHSC